MIKIAQIGCGYWGPNLLRNFQQNPNSEVIAVADPSQESREKIHSLYPEIPVQETPDSLFANPELDAVVIAAPAKYHYPLAKTALESGKDVLVEKPLALNVEQGRELLELSVQNERILMVGHLLEFHPAIEKIRELITEGKLGTLHHLRSTRLNLGKIRNEENVLWSFAPHDIAILHRLVGSTPTKIQAQAQTHLQEGIPDTVHAELTFADNVQAHLHVSWYEPLKEQKLTIIGSKAMCTYDDVSKELLFHPQYVDTDSTPPLPIKDQHHEIAFEPKEPLAQECAAFLSAIQTRQPPLTDGQSGLQVLQTLETIQALIEQD